MAGLEIVLAMLFKVAPVVGTLLIVWTAVAALYRAIPDGPAKMFLFRVRGEPDAQTPPHERLAVRAVVVGLCASLVLFITWLAG